MFISNDEESFYKVHSFNFINFIKLSVPPELLCEIVKLHFIDESIERS